MSQALEDEILAAEEAEHQARVNGEYVQLPDDLFIPPDALRIFLEAFEGPLDLLLYLIKKQNFDILDIPILEITKQYVQYVELIKSVQLELAADYLVMSATLAEIKSRMLLPREVSLEEEEDDPRAELVRRLQEYERFKKAAIDLDELPRDGRDTFIVKAGFAFDHMPAPPPDVSLNDLVSAINDALKRSDFKTEHLVEREPLSVRERMARILSVLQDSEEEFTVLWKFYTRDEGRKGVVVSFLAICEMMKEKLIDVVQSEAFAPIYVKQAGSEHDRS